MNKFNVVAMNGQPIKRNLLTVDEAWDQVFERAISKTKLYQMLQQGKIPAVKFDGKYILRRDTILTWMAEQEQATEA